MASNAGLILGGAALAGFALVAVKVFGGDEKKPATSGGGAGDLNVSDACEAALDKLPEPFHSMLLSPATDLGDPAVVSSIADQLDKAGYKQQADCMRKFAPAITAEHGVSGEDVSDNCSALIDADTRFDAAQRDVMKKAVREGTKEQLKLLATSVRYVNAKLANCIEMVGKDRVTMGGLDKTTIDILNGVHGEPAKEMSPEAQKIMLDMAKG